MSFHILKERKIRLDDSWDVIVIGGGPSGCAAATAAAREGARTLLIEATSALGGMGTSGLVPWFCGYNDKEKIIARGLAENVLYAMRDNIPYLRDEMKKYPLRAPAINPELLKRVYDKMVTEAGVEVLFGSSLCGVEKTDTGEFDNTLLISNKSGICAYRAKIYVDCTGDGDLAAWAGAKFEKGDESGAMQPATLCFIIANIDEKILAKGPNIHFEDPKSPIWKALRSEKYPLIVELHSCNMKIGERIFGFNTGHVFNVDNTNSMNVSKALLHGREMAEQYSNAFAEYHPAFAESTLIATGNLLGIRETRRIIGNYILTIDDYVARRSFPDEICRCAYEIDIHSSLEDSKNKSKKSIDELKKLDQAAARKLNPGESFGIPYRCLTPETLSNVLAAGRCISTDRTVNGSIRIMACCLNTGEAAGIAAAMAAKGTGNVHKVNTIELRQKLKDYGAYLPD